MKIWSRLMNSITAFREEFMNSSEGNEFTYESVQARRLRYSMYWGFYSNTAYAQANRWATSYKTDQNLYKYIRNIYSPAYRIGEFYREHLWGGLADLTDPTQGSLPVQTDNPAVLRALSVLWRDSNIQLLKDVVTLHGAIEGDVFLRVSDDPERGQVTLERVPAPNVAELDRDPMGNIKGYVIEEKRLFEGREVTYREEVSRDGDFVVYETFKDNAPFGWYGQPAAWEVAYGFVPMVHIQHNDVGLDYGWSEIHPARSKIQEVDEQASLLSDYLRKYSEPVWLVTGKRQGNVSIDDGDSDGTDEDKPGRNRLRLVSGFPESAKAFPLVTDMRVGDTLAHISAIQEELERDYPELQTDIWATGATSGRALRIARERVTSKAVQRRGNYDDGLARAQMMALSIGGMRNYPGYEGFDLDSYERGDIYHQIADRPVFPLDPQDEADISAAEWQAIKTAVDAGASLEGVLTMRGWAEEEIELIIGDAEDSEEPLTERVQVTEDEDGRD
jgi:hypothetical protein